MKCYDLLCIGKPGLQADNVMYTNAHTFSVGNIMLLTIHEHTYFNTSQASY